MAEEAAFGQLCEKEASMLLSGFKCFSTACSVFEYLKLLYSGKKMKINRSKSLKKYFLSRHYVSIE